MKSNELRDKFLQFFKEKEHVIIPCASLIPENDPTVLFTTAGMHPLVPYLLGQKHPEGKRLTNVQKCVRTDDIDEVGDATHCTFFEMLGNWSLGDYFKKEAISWSWEFLTSDKWLHIPKERLYFTVFAGDADAPQDLESYQYWIDLEVAEDHIYFLPKKYNWWFPVGITGPCGPDTEMFIDTGKPFCGPDCSPACNCGKFVEIWNDVFMEYNKTAEGTYLPLIQKNVDTGMGLERTICLLQGVESIYETDIFVDCIIKIAELSGKQYGQDEETTRAFRIIADHIRCATFMLGDTRGITPSNVDQGYVLRRLIRRAVRFGMQMGIPEGSTPEISMVVIAQYEHVYPELKENEAFILEELALEEDRFQKTLKQGLKEIEKLFHRLGEETKAIDGPSAFHLYDTFGFPVEFTVELAQEKGYVVDVAGFNESFRKHQERSQAGASQRFKGGLADHTDETARLHTATHLLHAALRQVLGDGVGQKGSNITAERLRFDFSFSHKMTGEELKEVERLVNEAIEAKADISCDELPLEEARKTGAIGLFESRYGNMVKIYTMGSYSKEICGGPHADNTGDLGHFIIQKEESSSAGVRRIKAILQ